MKNGMAISGKLCTWATICCTSRSSGTRSEVAAAAMAPMSSAWAMGMAITAPAMKTKSMMKDMDLPPSPVRGGHGPRGFGIGTWGIGRICSPCGCPAPARHAGAPGRLQGQQGQQRHAHHHAAIGQRAGNAQDLAALVMHDLQHVQDRKSTRLNSSHLVISY